jgi:hypothetical protein
MYDAQGFCCGPKSNLLLFLSFIAILIGKKWYFLIKWVNHY